MNVDVIQMMMMMMMMMMNDKDDDGYINNDDDDDDCHHSFIHHLSIFIILYLTMSRFEFIGEPALDAGGVAREFFNLICNEVGKR